MQGIVQRSWRQSFTRCVLLSPKACSTVRNVVPCIRSGQQDRCEVVPHPEMRLLNRLSYEKLVRGMEHPVSGSWA